MAIVHLKSSGTQAGVIQDGPGIAIAHTTDGTNSFAVTAVATAQGELRLIGWKLADAGRTIARIGDSSASPAVLVSVVAIAKAVRNNFFTGVRTAAGNLKLFAWNFDPGTGAIQRLAESPDQGPVHQIALVSSPLGDGRVLVAFRNGAGNLVLQNWMLDSNRHLVKVGEVARGAISRVALGTIGQRAFTAVRDGNGSLKIILFEVSAGGALTALGDSGAQGEPITLVDAVSLGSLIVTSVSTSSNNLKVISWKVSDGGATVTKKNDSGASAGAADRLATVVLPVNNVPGETGRVFTAVRTNGNRLKVIAWSVAESGAIARVEDFSDTPGTVDVVAFESAPSAFLSAVRDLDQRLRLDTWRLDTRTPPHGLAENIVISTRGSWENTSHVIAPPTLPRGRIVLLTGDKPPDYVTRDLLDPAGAGFAHTAAELRGSFPVSPALQGVSRLTADNQVIRLHDGTLMSSRNAHIWSDLHNPPPWFNTVVFDHSEETQQQRNAIIFFVSNDHGATWTQRSVIDSAVAANGDFGWPQENKEKHIGTYHAGGFDRTELYQDPWSKDIYATGQADGGPYTLNGYDESHHAVIVFRSKDNGATWQELQRLDGMQAPVVMTSTSAHPLVLLTRGSHLPKLFWLEKGASSLSGGDSVAVSEGGKIIPEMRDEGLGPVIRDAPRCIARIRGGGAGRDYVWIAYTTQNESGRLVYKLCVAGFGGGEPATSELVTTIESVDPASRLVCLGSFVQDDAGGTATTNPDNMTMFYWVDAPPETAADPNGLLVRYKMLFGAGGHFQSGYLSVANWKQRAFDQLAIGDYFKGAYFEWNNQIHFLAHWREPTGVRGNVVSI